MVCSGWTQADRFISVKQHKTTMKIVLLLGVVALAAVVKSQEMIGNGVDCEQIKTIIKAHNDLRKKIANGEQSDQPKASNMQKIVWDDNLAVIAQNWADGMKFAHNPDRKDSRWDVGENIYMSFGGPPDTKTDWNGALKSWYSEHEKYTYGPNGQDLSAGHYTQVVWADTMYVGCGFTSFSDAGTNKKLYVCDYGPAGNFYGEYPYKTGAGCEDLCCKDQCHKSHGNKC